MISNCRKCQDAFQNEGFEFKPSFCKFCKLASENQKNEILNNETERKWGSIDWNSCQYSDYYKG